MPLETDQDLAKRIRNGDIKAFDMLYEQYSQRLYGFAYSLLKNKEDSKEIVQETFLRVWGKRKDIDQAKSLKSLLFTISYNITIDSLRKKLKDNEYVDYLRNQFGQVEPGVENSFDFNDLTDRLEHAIEKLPTQRQIVYRMSREQGLSHKEIAEKLSINTKTVENHINLSLKFLRQTLGADSLMILLFASLFL